MNRNLRKISKYHKGENTREDDACTYLGDSRMSVVVSGETGDTSKDGDNDKEREKTEGDSTASLVFTRR